MSEPHTVDETKAEVREFWEAGPCGAKHADSPEGTAEFYAEVERKRNELEPFIPGYADFASTADKDVLEIGVGVGTDFIRFARAGARVTGVDLTEHSVVLVRGRLVLEGFDGDVRVADAEALPFENDTFDVVYSWGVLHHTPRPERAMGEALRVLKPGGRLCVMVYARFSWVAFGLWGRYALLRGRPWRSLASVVADHMESTGTRAYTKRELLKVFDSLQGLSLEKVGTPYDRRVAGPLATLSGRTLGWFLVVRGTKSA